MISTTDFNHLVDRTIEQLQSLKQQGHTHVQLSPDVFKSTVPAVRFSKTGSSKSAVDHAALPHRDPACISEAPTEIFVSLTGDKREEMEKLRQQTLVCQKCPHLVKSRTQVVFGVGNIDAELMFIGEAPGADEDKKGEPFVGAAGQLLTRMISAMGFAREEVYIANILKCRPDTPGKSFGNRPPTPEEMDTCIPYLRAQIKLIRPKVMVALGATATSGLLKQKASITRLRGTWFLFQNIPVMPTYHPSYLLHNEAILEKRKVWEDLLLVLEKLGRPISEKQRNYFLNAIKK